MAPSGNDQRGSETAPRPPRILIVEDEFLVAALLQADLVAAGCTVVGPYTSLASALKAARRESFDLAVLDVNLHGEMVYPLADDLSAQGIPFLFLSGYGPQSVPEKYRSAPRIAKPYDPVVLMAELRRLTTPARS